MDLREYIAAYIFKEGDPLQNSLLIKFGGPYII